MNPGDKVDFVGDIYLLKSSKRKNQQNVIKPLYMTSIDYEKGFDLTETPTVTLHLRRQHAGETYN